MRTCMLALAVVAAYPGTASSAGETDGTYILRFAEAPLAAWRGPDAATDAEQAKLAATSPAATGSRRIELDSPASRAYRGFLDKRRTDRLRSAEALLGRPLEVRYVYEVAFNGLAAELSPAEAETLRRLPGVIAVERSEARRLQTDAGPGWIGAPVHWTNAGLAGTSRGEGSVIGVIDSGIRPSHPAFAATAGDGYVHVNPRGRFFGQCVAAPARCNGKLIGIHDFTLEDARNGVDLNGHGTHVASTAAGNPYTASHTFGDGVQRTLTFSGVAPRSALISYKACVNEEGTSGSCATEDLVAAIDQAVADGVDVINYSIGGSPRSPWSGSDALAMLSAREAGVVVVVAAGNDGPAAGSITAPGNAPWVLTVAASTHDRALANRLVDLQGGATAPPRGGILGGLGLTPGVGPRAIVRDAANPLCSRGMDLDFPPTGASNPWVGQVFSGELVVCERGVTARVAKSNNVRLAGGGGMILYNGPADGESVVADAHSIPGTHIGWSAGRDLLDWLADGAGHSGRLEGVQLRSLPDYADLLAGFSGRGQAAFAAEALKPDITAPGVAILAASHENNGVAMLSGTSMATPHVAGAAALLRAASRDWGPSHIESALQTTARAVVRAPDGSVIASPFDQGSGRVDLGRAAAAGLYFPVSRADFLAAAPGGSSSPAELNRPSLVLDDCFEQCSLMRRVTGLRATAWSVVFDLPEGASASATPARFDLGMGGTQPVSFSFDLTGTGLPGTWVQGAVRLVPDDSSVPEVRLPVALFADPGGDTGRIEVSAAAEAGAVALDLGGYVRLPEAAFAVTELIEPTRRSLLLVEDPTPLAPYDRFDMGGVLIEQVSFGEGTGAGRIEVSTASTQAPDIDLFVGLDANGDGLPSEDEELCRSTSPAASEVCMLHVDEADADDRYWVLVQSWEGSGAIDRIELTSTAVRLAPATSGARVVGPGKADAGIELPLRLDWDLPGLSPGSERRGYLLLANVPDRLDDMVVLPLHLVRVPAWNAAPRVLRSGQNRRLRLPPGEAQDRYVIEVPPGAASLTLSSIGAPDVQLHLARQSESAGPAIGPAPARATAAASSSGSSANKQIVVNGAALEPGRWYLTPVNTGAQAVEFDLEADLQFSGARPTPQPGAYYNPARSGAGVYFYTVAAANVWGVVWYTYDADGAPTWYLGTAAAATPGEHLWRVELSRFTWNGQRVQFVSAGEAYLSLESSDRFRFAWNVLGDSGSESMQLIPQPACAAGPLAVSGLWYSPTRPGFGYSVLAGEGLETFVAYLYDGLGRPRWLLGNVSPFAGSGSMSLRQYSGACPLCTYAPPQSQVVGTLQRLYLGGALDEANVDAVFAPPLQGQWIEGGKTRAIADLIGCP